MDATPYITPQYNTVDYQNLEQNQKTFRGFSLLLTGCGFLLGFAAVGGLLYVGISSLLVKDVTVPANCQFTSVIFVSGSADSATYCKVESKYFLLPENNTTIPSLSPSLSPSPSSLPSSHFSSSKFQNQTFSGPIAFWPGNKFQNDETACKSLQKDHPFNTTFLCRYFQPENVLGFTFTGIVEMYQNRASLTLTFGSVGTVALLIFGLYLWKR